MLRRHPTWQRRGGLALPKQIEGRGRAVVEFGSNPQADAPEDKMADRIICQGPGYTIAESDKASGMVPYHAVVRANGDQNQGFIDIRDRPELVSLIPELQKSDGFAALAIGRATCRARVCQYV